MQDFDEYIRQGEPSQKEKAQIWQTAIGLQDVDGLKVSDYLIETAKENIEGRITIDEVQYRIAGYYKQQQKKEQITNNRTEEADKVATNITEILSEKTFVFSPAELTSIHRRLFTGVETMRVKIGKYRDYNITKSEWVLNGKTVFYASADTIAATLDYDFKEEKNFKYNGLTKREIVEHIVKFISGVWQIHAFGEGNTRTVAVFTIKYLRNFGFNVENDMFANHSRYFRNALVRANFNDYEHQIYATPEFLLKFFGNLLFGENNELKNRFLHINFNAKNDNSKEQNLHLTKNSDSQNVGEMSEKRRRNVGEMSEKQKQIIKLISENNTISAKQISVQLKTSDRTIERDIKKLTELKIIERIGADRGGFWQIIS